MDTVRYVVAVYDEYNRRWAYGDIETTKSHAQRWANNYMRQGFLSFALRADKVGSLDE